MSAGRPGKVRPLWLTEEDASNLLTLAVASTANLGQAEERLLLKLGEICRAFFRDTDEPSSPSKGEAPRPRRLSHTSSAMAARRRMQRSTPRALIVTRA